MGLFGRVKVTRPVPVPPPAGDVLFPGTTISVRNTVIAITGGQYAPTVMQHLNDIQGFVVGQALFQAITAYGKKQVIKYAGPNANQAAGGGLASYKVLRRYHDCEDKANFATQLQATITASTHDKHWLATQCYQTLLPLWSGASSTSPLKNVPCLRRTPTSAPPTPIQAIEQRIDIWLAGTALPSLDEMDILCLVLEPWLTNGGGSNTLISYDPHKVKVGNLDRPPQVALFHELMHAYYNAAGGQLGREDSADENNGGRLFELMAVGLPPFDTRTFSENQFRVALGVAKRMAYP
jgi:hypothetical protein